MSPSRTLALPSDERLQSLLADEALVGLSQAEREELEMLLAEHGFSDGECLERSAAAIDLSMTTEQTIPAALRAKLVKVGTVIVREQSEPVFVSDVAGRIGFEPASGNVSSLGWLGWVAAAACLVLAFIAWNQQPSSPQPLAPVALSAAEQREALLKEPDCVVMTWSDWELNGQGPEFPGVKGDVIWSESKQKGFMRFVGLPANDPRIEQYQLWIVDQRGLFDPSGQSARISGGVFNASADGELIVPFSPRLLTQKAALFALTIEKPGGTWVSDMSRRVVVAAVPAPKSGG